MAMSDSYLVAVVDDDEAVRISTTKLLTKAGHTVESFAGGDALLASELLDQMGCILLDMRMPGMNGLDVMRILQGRERAPAILVLTAHGDVPLAIQAMRLGAFDFLEKPYPRADLLDAVRKACTRPPPPRAGPVVDPEAAAKLASLSVRQRELLYGVLKGQQNKIIAYEMGLSVRTVESYRAQLLMRLGVRSTAEAVRIAMAGGMAVE